MKHSIVKRYKVLHVVDETGKSVYSPPGFLKPVNSRSDLQIVVDGFDSGRPGNALTCFECKFRSRKVKFPCECVFARELNTLDI